MGRRRGPIAVTLFVAAIVLLFLLVDRLLPIGHPRQTAAAHGIAADEALGATLEPLDRETAEGLGVGSNTQGLVVTSLSAHGPADLVGIRAGDIIERVGGKPVRSLGDADAAIGKKPHQLSLTLNRHGHYAIVRVSARSANPRGGAE